MTGDEDRAQRFLVEVQRSLDVWDRSWSSMPLNGLRVYAGERSEELSRWLTTQLGQTVVPMDVSALFPGFKGEDTLEQTICMPLLGVLMRTVSRQL
jgi:MSHA biogenesis protein MshI